VSTLAKLLAGILIGAALTPLGSDGHYKAGSSHNVYHASLYAWCGSSYSVCANGVKAYRVASCESRFNRWATNGQYHGLWQVGRYERGRCGQTLGRDPWSQARAAHCWWRLTSWGSWACA
jgi:hypothetical protein